MRVDTIELYSNDILVASFDVNVIDIRNPYIIKAMAGLDADVIIPRFYGTGLVSLQKFYELSMEPRDIVMRIGLNPNYNLNRFPADLRGDLYKAISSARDGKLQLRFLYNNSPVGGISGFVSKFEAPLFSKDTEVQITLKCEDPFIRSLYTANHVVTELDITEPIITDPISTAPHGFKFQITFTDAVNPFTIQNAADPDWKFRIDYNFLEDDVLYFSSEFGDKYLYIERDAAIIHLMDALEPGAVWPILFPGENRFYVIGTDFTWDQLYYYETHWGV